MRAVLYILSFTYGHGVLLLACTLRHACDLFWYEAGAGYESYYVVSVPFAGNSPLPCLIDSIHSTGHSIIYPRSDVFFVLSSLFLTQTSTSIQWYRTTTSKLWAGLLFNQSLSTVAGTGAPYKPAPSIQIIFSSYGDVSHASEPDNTACVSVISSPIAHGTSVSIKQIKYPGIFCATGVWKHAKLIRLLLRVRVFCESIGHLLVVHPVIYTQLAEIFFLSKTFLE